MIVVVAMEVGWYGGSGRDGGLIVMVVMVVEWVWWFDNDGVGGGGGDGGVMVMVITVLEMEV